MRGLKSLIPSDWKLKVTQGLATMSLFSFFQKNPPSALIEERLHKAREDAYRYATAQLSHGDVNLMTDKGITQKEIDVELKVLAGELAELEKLRNA